MDLNPLSDLIISSESVLIFLDQLRFHVHTFQEPFAAHSKLCGLTYSCSEP